MFTSTTTTTLTFHHTNRQVSFSTLLVLLIGSTVQQHQLSATAAAQELLATSSATVCGPTGLAVLGTNSWDTVQARVDVTVDATCQYTLAIQFQHNATALPVPTDPAVQCNPAVVPPVLAADGLPYYAPRWFYEKVPDHVYAATGIDHVSFDYAPCGHPPVNVFTAPHYDLHTYRVTPEYRTCMTCDLLPGTPVCNFPIGDADPVPQTTASGQAFFAPVDVSNMPADYIYLKSDNLPYMGGHAASLATLPANASVWTEPVLIVGPYNGTNLFYEPMIPLVAITGPNDTMFRRNVSYVAPTMDNLPSEWRVEYQASSGVVIVTMIGPSSVCQDELCEVFSGDDLVASFYCLLLTIARMIRAVIVGDDAV